MTEKEFDNLEDGFYWVRDKFDNNWRTAKKSGPFIEWTGTEMETHINELEKDEIEFGGPCLGSPDEVKLSDIVSVKITREPGNHSDELKDLISKTIIDFLESRGLEPDDLGDDWKPK